MKKVITMLLAVLLLLQTVACAESSDNAEETAAPEAGSSEVTGVEEIVEETEPAITDDLPESNFEGYEFVIFNSNPETNTWFTTVHVDVDEDSGDAIPSAIFNRNLMVEERLNIKITETEQTADQIKNTILAGDGAFDMSLMQGSNILSHAQAGYLMNLHTLPYLNFEKPYWDANAVEQLSTRLYEAFIFVLGNLPYICSVKRESNSGRLFVSHCLTVVTGSPSVVRNNSGNV
jgi:maltose-binding protein MalE